MAMWGLTVVFIIFGYRPPPRHARLDGLSIWQKIQRLDLPGMGMLTAGLTLLLTGLSLGQAPWPWSSGRVVATLVAGCVILVAFGVYEWKGTKIGILHHDLFSMGRTFAICIGLIFIEGIMLFTIIVFYPALTINLFETNPFLVAARGIPFWICAGCSTVLYGFASSKFRTIRSPLLIGFVLFTTGMVGLATVQPGQSTRTIVFDGLAGLGFGAPFILVIAGVQLSTPHHLIATATAVVTSSRAVAASTFTAIYGAALSTRLDAKIPAYIAKAALAAGLPPSSLPAFVSAIATKDVAALPTIPGVTPPIIAAAIAAVSQALADGFRIIFIIAAPFGLVAIVACYFLGDLSKTMHYRVDAPMEEIHAKHHHETAEAA
ncbi:MAG: hypothetical protein CYPHOPRED_003766 [Cyphobasidiales sp. Tagirdzhanova-0007]|nr:MAG: hypothetical protein CYPHOPRED_003766 [Cyphobasidiales sp. Tagirdzhanova-0007]